MTYFVEIRTPLGRWAPQLHDDYPTRRTVEGIRTFRADPVEVLPDLAAFGLDAVAMLLSPDGQMHGTLSQGEWLAFLKMPPASTLTLSPSGDITTSAP